MTGLFPRAARSPVCDGEMPSFTAHRRRGVAHRRLGRSSVGARADVARVLPHVAAPRGRCTVVARSPRCPSPASPPVRLGHPHPHGTNPTRMDDGPFTATHGLCSLCGAVATCPSTPAFRGHGGDDPVLDRWRVTGGGRWFGYGLATGSLTEFPYTPRYNSPFSEFVSDDRGVLFKGSVSYRFDDETYAYVTRSEGVPHRRRQQLPGLHRRGDRSAHQRRRQQRLAAIRLHLRRSGVHPTGHEDQLRGGAAPLMARRTVTLSATLFHVD